ncbi:MAG TPA: hypothetical protein VEZ46_15765 [Mycobacteriales bacterium]|nr:hypothetical protein [Mycobacteriales bacterium]
MADLEGEYDVRLELVHNARAAEWNNAYSPWVARSFFADGVLLGNGDTVHPVSVEETLLAHDGAQIVLGADTRKTLGDEEIKVVLGRPTRWSGRRGATPRSTTRTASSSWPTTASGSRSRRSVRSTGSRSTTTTTSPALAGSPRAGRRRRTPGSW